MTWDKSLPRLPDFSRNNASVGTGGAIEGKHEASDGHRDRSVHGWVSRTPAPRSCRECRTVTAIGQCTGGCRLGLECSQRRVPSHSIRKGDSSMVRLLIAKNALVAGLKKFTTKKEEGAALVEYGLL